MKIEYKGQDIDPFEEYAKIKQQQKELETKRLEMEAIVQDMLDEEGQKDKITRYGRFWSMGRKSWEYSQDVKAKAEELSKMKKTEEIKGIATIKKITSYIMLDTKEKSE